MPSRMLLCIPSQEQGKGENINQYVAALRLILIIWRMSSWTNWSMAIDSSDYTLDEACAAELSNLSMAEIQKTISLSAARANAMMHHDDADPEQVTLDDNDIHRLKVVPGESGVGEKKHPQMGCASCGENHLQATCRFKNAGCLHCCKMGNLAKVCRAPQPAEFNQSKGQPFFKNSHAGRLGRA
ncbi:hypothetical protein E2320_008032, partial [Naja naja]